MRSGRRDLVQLILRGSRRGAEAPLLLLRTLREFSGARLQIKRPVAGLRDSAYLDLLAGGLKSEHLHFHGIGSRSKSGEFVGARLVSSGDHAMVALSGDNRGSRQRLSAEFDDSRGRDVGRRACLCV